jgi:hypothetical protein
MNNFLELFGFCTLICMGCFLIYVLWCGLVELVDILKRRYIIKHRFDKPPTAKCYCRDCVRHDDENQRCYKFDGWYTADSWFCWDAEPRKEVKP